MRGHVTFLAWVAGSLFAGVVGALGGEVRGRVLMGPSCPGPAKVGAPCAQPRQPVQTIVDVFTDGVSPGTPIASASSDSSGQFQLNLPNGRYLIVPRSLRPGESGKPIEVVVTDSVTNVVLKIDRGMR